MILQKRCCRGNPLRNTFSNYLAGIQIWICRGVRATPLRDGRIPINLNSGIHGVCLHILVDLFAVLLLLGLNMVEHLSKLALAKLKNRRVVQS